MERRSPPYPTTHNSPGWHQTRRVPIKKIRRLKNPATASAGTSLTISWVEHTASHLVSVRGTAAESSTNLPSEKKMNAYNWKKKKKKTGPNGTHCPSRSESQRFKESGVFHQRLTANHFSTLLFFIFLFWPETVVCVCLWACWHIWFCQHIYLFNGARAVAAAVFDYSFRFLVWRSKDPSLRKIYTSKTYQTQCLDILTHWIDEWLSD